MLYYESFITLEPGDVDLATLQEADHVFLREEVELLQSLFAFKVVAGEDETFSLGAIRVGTLRVGQVVTEEQDRLLKKLFGRTDHEYREKRRRPGRDAPGSGWAPER